MSAAHLDQYRALASYNARFNEALYAKVAGLDAATRTRDLGAFFGSIEGTLNHILLADRVWLSRMRESGHPFPSLASADWLLEVRSLEMCRQVLLRTPARRLSSSQISEICSVLLPSAGALATDSPTHLQSVAPDFETLRVERVATDQLIVAWAAELTDDILAAPMRYRNLSGTEREHVVWIAVSHLFNHQTHHRGQVTTLLKQVGVDPGVTDFLVYALA